MFVLYTRLSPFKLLLFGALLSGDILDKARRCISRRHRPLLLLAAWHSAWHNVGYRQTRWHAHCDAALVIGAANWYRSLSLVRHCAKQHQGFRTWHTLLLRLRQRITVMGVNKSSLALGIGRGHHSNLGTQFGAIAIADIALSSARYCAGDASDHRIRWGAQTLDGPSLGWCDIDCWRAVWYATGRGGRRCARCVKYGFRVPVPVQNFVACTMALILIPVAVTVTVTIDRWR